MKVVKSQELTSFEGYRSEPTDWLLINQERVDHFADTTLDHQFIHVDPVRAAQSPFGGTIAHGMLTLSLMAHFAESFALSVEDAAMGLNYGFDKVRFLTPVKVGARVRAHATLAKVTEKSPSQYLLNYEVDVEVDGDSTPALVTNWLCLIISAG